MVLTLTASEDYAKGGLRVNSVCHGYIETPTINPTLVAVDAMEGRVATAMPMQRQDRPPEMADYAVYLCGGKGSYVAAIALFVKGGYSQR